MRSFKLSRAESMHFARFLASLHAKTMLFAVLCCLQNPSLPRRSWINLSLGKINVLLLLIEAAPPDMYETLQIMGYLPYQPVSRISEPSTISFSDLGLGTCIQFVVDYPRSISGIWAGAGVVGELPLGCQKESF